MLSYGSDVHVATIAARWIPIGGAELRDLMCMSQPEQRPSAFAQFCRLHAPSPNEYAFFAQSSSTAASWKVIASMGVRPKGIERRT